MGFQTVSEATAVSFSTHRLGLQSVRSSLAWVFASMHCEPSVHTFIIVGVLFTPNMSESEIPIEEFERLYEIPVVVATSECEQESLSESNTAGGSKDETVESTLLQETESISGKGITVKYNEHSRSHISDPELTAIHHGEKTEYYRFRITDIDRRECVYIDGVIDDVPKPVLNSILASGFYFESANQDPLYHYLSNVELCCDELANMQEKYNSIPFINLGVDCLATHAYVYEGFLKAKHAFQHNYQDIISELEYLDTTTDVESELRDLIENDPRSCYVTDDGRPPVEDIMMQPLSNGDILLPRVTSIDIYPHIYLKHVNESTYVCETPSIEYILPTVGEQLDDEGILIDNVSYVGQDLPDPDVVKRLDSIVDAAPEIEFNGISLTESVRRECENILSALVMIDCYPDTFKRSVLKTTKFINEKDDYPDVSELRADHPVYGEAIDIVTNNFSRDQYVKISKEMKRLYGEKNLPPRYEEYLE